MIRTFAYGFVYLNDDMHEKTFLNCWIIGRMPLNNRKFGVNLLTSHFNQIALTKEYREKIEPLTQSYQHNIDNNTTNVLFDRWVNETEVVNFFKEQIRLLKGNVVHKEIYQESKALDELRD